MARGRAIVSDCTQPVLAPHARRSGHTHLPPRAWLPTGRSWRTCRSAARSSWRGEGRQRWGVSPGAAVGQHRAAKRTAVVYQAPAPLCRAPRRQLGSCCRSPWFRRAWLGGGVLQAEGPSVHVLTRHATSGDGCACHVCQSHVKWVWAAVLCVSRRAHHAAGPCRLRPPPPRSLLPPHAQQAPPPTLEQQQQQQVLPEVRPPLCHPEQPPPRQGPSAETAALPQRLPTAGGLTAATAPHHGGPPPHQQPPLRPGCCCLGG